MHTQSYALPGAEDLKLPEQPVFTEEDLKRHATMSFIGMNERRDHERSFMEARDRLWLASKAYPELESRTLHMWRSFLPTTETIASFKYDPIPHEALKALMAAQQYGCFARIEIWTPEGNSFRGNVERKYLKAKEDLARMRGAISSMAVGVVIGPDGQEHFFQLVRWGKSLMPLNKIARNVWLVKLQMLLIFRILPGLLGVVTFVGYYMLIERFGFWPVIGVTVVAVLLIFFVAVMSVDE